MYTFFTEHKRSIGIVGLLALLALVGWIIYYTVFLFHITSITPDTNAVSFEAPQLTVSFNKNLSSDALSVTADALSITSKTEGKKLIISLPATMQSDETYSFTIHSIHSTSGDVITNKVIVIKTVSNTNSITDADQKIILDRQEANKSPVINDPIFNYLPHSTLDYSMDGEISNADTENQEIIITVNLILSAADETIGRDAAVAQYKSEATDYLASLKDVDLSKYTIQYTVTDPTL